MNQMCLCHWFAMLCLYSLFVAVFVAPALAANDDARSLFAFGNVDVNDYQCNAVGVPRSAVGCADTSAGHCSACVPTLVASGVSAACTGRAHSLFLLGNGTLLGTGAVAFLGLDATRSAPTSRECASGVLLAIPVPNNERVVAARCGDSFSALLTAAGNVFVFGFNVGGVFGRPESSLAHVATPTLVFLEPSGTPPATRVADIFAAKRSLVLLLRNGSVAVLGTGTLRVAANGDSASDREAQQNAGGGAAWVSLPTWCRVRRLVPGFVSAGAVCTNGSVVVWGSNANRELEDSDMVTIVPPRLLAPLVASNGVEVAVALPRVGDLDEEVGVWDSMGLAFGVGHSLAVDTSGRVWGRGDSGAGQLALPNNSARAASWTRLPSFTARGRASRVVAGNGVSFVASRWHTALAQTPSVTNFASVGSNAACALGLGRAPEVAAGVTNPPFVLFPDTGITRVVLRAWATGDHRRVFVLVGPAPTRSASRTAPTPTAPSTTATATLSAASVSLSAPTLSSSGTISAPSPSFPSASVSPTLTAWSSTMSRPTPSPTQPSPSRRTTTESASAATHSTTTFTAPRLVRAVVALLDGQLILVVSFDAPTDQHERLETRIAPTAAAVDRLFRVSGLDQTFGRTYRGAWTTASEFQLVMDPLVAVVVVGRATVSCAPESRIRSASGLSPPASSGFSVVVSLPSSAVTSAASSSNRDNPAVGWPGWATTLTIALAAVLGAAAVAAIVTAVFCLRTRRARQREAVIAEACRVATAAAGAEATEHVPLPSYPRPPVVSVVSGALGTHVMDSFTGRPAVPVRAPSPRRAPPTGLRATSSRTPPRVAVAVPAALHNPVARFFESPPTVSHLDDRRSLSRQTTTGPLTTDHIPSGVILSCVAESPHDDDATAPF